LICPGLEKAGAGSFAPESASALVGALESILVELPVTTGCSSAGAEPLGELGSALGARPRDEILPMALNVDTVWPARSAGV